MLLSPAVLQMVTAPVSVAVSTSVLGIFRTSSWSAASAASANANRHRWIEVTNCDALGGLDAYVDFVSAGGTLTGAVSSSDFFGDIPPTESRWFFVPNGYELVVVRGSTSTAKVKAAEYAVVGF